MKTRLTSCLSILAVIADTSCAPFFSKDDAAKLGAEVAAKSLAVANDYLAGKPVDLRAEAGKLGLQMASEAVGIVATNLSANAPKDPAAVVSDSAETASGVIAADKSTSEQAAELAGAIVAVAEADAAARLAKP